MLQAADHGLSSEASKSPNRRGRRALARREKQPADGLAAG